jgi:hypothetical protein
MGVMSADFKRIENGPENNRYNEARDKDSYIDFESQTSDFHFCNILKLNAFQIMVCHVSERTAF